MITRLYGIINLYLNGVQAGIQAAHAISEMSVEYTDRVVTNLWYDQWVRKDKTIILLDGGYQSNLQRIYDLAQKIPSLPQAKFHEEEAALNGALTAVAIVLPEYMFNPQYSTGMEVATNTSLVGGLQIANQYKDIETGAVLHHYTQPEKDLIQAIKALGLKR